MHFADQSGLLGLLRLLIGRCESCYPHMLGSFCSFFFSPSITDEKITDEKRTKPCTKVV